MGTRAHTWVGATCDGVETVETIMEPPPTGTRRNILPALIIQGVTTVREHGGGRRDGDTYLLLEALQEAHDLAQPLEREQRRWVSWRRSRWCARIVRRTHGECGVGPIRKLDDEVRINALPAPDQHDPLAAQRVMWMGDRDRFRR